MNNANKFMFFNIKIKKTISQELFFCRFIVQDAICGRIIKLEKNTKLLVDKKYVVNNGNYYITIRVELNKEAKIINSELKEFGNNVEIKIINTVSGLIQDNLNQKPNNGIYEFPLISFKTKFKKDINAIETIENIKDESTYLLPFLIESSRNPPKILTITQKIQEEKENIENYLTDLKHKKLRELRETEEYILSRDIKNWKIVDNSKENLEKEFNQKNNKWYILIFAKRFILKEKCDQNDKIKLFDFYNTADRITYKAITFGQAIYFTLENLVFYRWDGDIDEPNTPIIDL